MPTLPIHEALDMSAPDAAAIPANKTKKKKVSFIKPLIVPIKVNRKARKVYAKEAQSNYFTFAFPKSTQC